MSVCVKTIMDRRLRLKFRPAFHPVEMLCRFYGLMLAMTLAVPGICLAGSNDVLTTTAAIHALTPDEAAHGIPLLVTGVVTAAAPEWNGRFFVQDSTGGLWINDTNEPVPVAGDLLQVSGVSHAGGYSQNVVSSHWKKMGTAPLPDARPVSAERLASGVEDGWRVEVSGMVTSEKTDNRGLVLVLSSGGARFQAMLPLSTNVDQISLVGALVRLRGTAATSYNVRQKHVRGVSVYVPLVSDLEVDQASTSDTLTNAADILSQTSDQAARVNPVLVTGVVTVAEPNWNGDFFVQDTTGGVYVINRTTPQPQVGDLVQIRGVSQLGAYAPDVLLAHWTRLGTAPLPAAVPVSTDRLMSGAEDGRRVEVTGVIRSAHQSQLVTSRMALELVCGGFRFRAFPPFSTNLDPNALVGATVHLRGTVAASSNASLRRIMTVVMFVPQSSDLIIDQFSGDAVFHQPLTPLNSIAQYRVTSDPEPRIHVRGVVTYQRPGQDIFLHDAGNNNNPCGLQVECTDTNIFAPGDIVEAVGFPALERSLPVLQDAVLIRAKESGVPATPVKTGISKLLGGFNHADLVSLQGILLDCSLRPLLTVPGLSNSPSATICTLQSSNYFFKVVAPATDKFARLGSIPIGSTLTVTGICMLQADEFGKIDAAQILLPDPADLQIVKQPNWFTARRLLIGLGLLLATSFVAVTWTCMILRRNSALKLSIAEKIQARNELQKAHDQLETRVQERTRQLKFEMGARQEAEVQYKAVLAERTRLAQELHDTLLQGFTGIGLKLDAFARSLPTGSEKLQQILEQSDQYLTEARRTIWELRSPSLEKNQEFSQALLYVSNRSLQGTGIHLDFSVVGDARPLPPAVEDNLLRICEEAVMNAVKHARPRQTQICLEYAVGQVHLRIRDDGCGFDPNGAETVKAGHFGLVGIRERVNSVHGNLSLHSQLGQGTQIIVTIPDVTNGEPPRI